MLSENIERVAALTARAVGAAFVTGRTMTTTTYRCTECDKTYDTLAVAAMCHWGIGGVIEEQDTTMNTNTEPLPAEAQAALDRGERLWTTTELQQDFAVEGFAAPYVVVRRKADGQRGSMQFTHQPRYYFGFEPTDIEG